MANEEGRGQPGFVEEYEALCVKYGLYIWSCGCCPPMVEPISEIDFSQHLKMLKE